ncbi:NAD-binding protein [Mycena kentingensis (nom. inval.)]|nr:NAD-binding protein [Mycena kentingensis (nom. inval.)]
MSKMITHMKNRVAERLGSSQGLSEADLFSLTGKIAIVTGGASGLGVVTAQLLARQGAKVYIGARDGVRARAAIKNMEDEGLGNAGGSVHWLDLDQSDPRNARRAAKEFMELETRLDMVVNNAGKTYPGPFFMNQDGLLDIITINHISHFALVDALLPVLEATAKEDGSDVRIVNLTSSVYTSATPTSFATRETLNADYGTGVQNVTKTYGQTKLANILHAKELQARFTARGIPVTCMAVHPGSLRTASSEGFWSMVPVVAPLGQWIFSNGAPRDGALVIAFAAAGRKVAEKRAEYAGAYVVPRGKIGEQSATAMNTRLQKELWETTEEILEGLH